MKRRFVFGVAIICGQGACQTRFLGGRQSSSQSPLERQLLCGDPQEHSTFHHFTASTTNTLRLGAPAVVNRVPSSAINTSLRRVHEDKETFHRGQHQEKEATRYHRPLRRQPSWKATQTRTSQDSPSPHCETGRSGTYRPPPRSNKPTAT